MRFQHTVDGLVLTDGNCTVYEKGLNAIGFSLYRPNLEVGGKPVDCDHYPQTTTNYVFGSATPHEPEETVRPRVCGQCLDEKRRADERTAEKATRKAWAGSHPKELAFLTELTELSRRHGIMIVDGTMGMELVEEDPHGRYLGTDKYEGGLHGETIFEWDERED